MQNRPWLRTPGLCFGLSCLAGLLTASPEHPWTRPAPQHLCDCHVLCLQHFSSEEARLPQRTDNARWLRLTEAYFCSRDALGGWTRCWGRLPHVRPSGSSQAEALLSLIDGSPDGPGDHRQSTWRKEKRGLGRTRRRCSRPGWKMMQVPPTPILLAGAQSQGHPEFARDAGKCSLAVCLEEGVLDFPISQHSAAISSSARQNCGYPWRSSSAVTPRIKNSGLPIMTSFIHCAYTL